MVHSLVSQLMWRTHYSLLPFVQICTQIVTVKYKVISQNSMFTNNGHNGGTIHLNMCLWLITAYVTKPFSVDSEGIYLVQHVVRAGVVHLHNHVGVQEVGGDHVGHEGCALVLEHHGDDVVPDVPLPLQLRSTASQREYQPLFPAVHFQTEWFTERLRK